MGTAAINLGRTYVRPEYLQAGITARPNKIAIFNRNNGLTEDRFWAGVTIEWRGRVAWTANGPTGVLPEHWRNIINRIRLTGSWKRRGGDQVTPIDVYGADLKQMIRVINQSNVADDTDSAPTASATGSYDVSVFYYIPFSLLGPWTNKASRVVTAFDAPNWNSLQFEFHVADDLSVFTGQTTAGTFTAYGSASGDPEIRVTQYYYMSQNKMKGVPTSLVYMTTETVEDDGVITGASEQHRIYAVPKGRGAVLAYFLRTGTKATTVTSGNRALLTLSDTLLTEIALKLGTTNTIRSGRDFRDLGNQAAIELHGDRPSSGSALILFPDRGDLDSMFQTQQFQSGSTDSVDVNIAAKTNSASSANVLRVTRVEVEGLR